MKTEGLWYLGERRIEMRAMEIPEPGPEDVLIELEACGICNWDIQSYAGNFGKHHPYPFCAGHEGVGRVAAVGDKVDRSLIGARVTMEERPIGEPGGALMVRHAIRRVDRTAVLPEDGLAPEFWVVEPACCIVNGILYSGLQPGDRVAVAGTGYMGLLFVQGLKSSLTGRLSAFDLDRSRLELAAEFGADDVFHAAEEVTDELAGAYDLVIETAANPKSLELAFRLARPGAIIQPFAWHHHDYGFDLEDWHLRGLRIMNIQPQMNPHFGDLYARTVALMANGTLSNRKLITHTAPVEGARDAFEEALERKSGYMKGVILF